MKILSFICTLLFVALGAATAVVAQPEPLLLLTPDVTLAVGVGLMLAAPRGQFNIPVVKPGMEQLAASIMLNLDPEKHDASKFRKVVQLFNKAGTTFGDVVTGRQKLKALSSPSGNADPRYSGIPAAVTFGDGDRYVVDTRWLASFVNQDYRGRQSPYFRINDVYNAITFKQYQQGERIEIGFVKTAEGIHQAEIFAGGLQWNGFWADFQDMWDESAGLAAIQSRYADKMADIAYGILTAATGLTTVTRDATGANTLEQDINTINAAITEIEKSVYEDTIPDSDIQTNEDVMGRTFTLYYNSHTSGYEDRVIKALSARLDAQNDNQSVGYVKRPVMPVGSPKVPTGKWFLVLNGRKIVNANFRDLRIASDRDIRLAGEVELRVGQGAYKMVVGDNNQRAGVPVA